MNKVTSLKIEQEVKAAQAAIDVFAPGKVEVLVTNEDGTLYMVGEYMYEKYKYTTWIEKLFISRKGMPFYDRDVFIGFFKQRADWLNASLEIKEDCAAAGMHPSQYKVGDQSMVSALTGDVCFMREV